MSGVAAVLRLDGSPAEPPILAAMLERLRHRGEDGCGAHVAGPVALGHQLLATTPEDTLERQPIVSAKSGSVITAVARVDNRAELLAELGGPTGLPDAAVILRAYERWGDDCVGRLEGDFAFAIWDPRRRILLCARDPIGLRPLYYQVDARAFRCASEMQALFGDPAVPRRPDRLAMALFLLGDYGERDQTLYEGVRALPAGHALTVRAGSIRTWRHWSPDPWREVPHASDEEHAEHFRALFSNAVRRRLRARGPIAVSVSGGLDSSAVACEAARLHRNEHGAPEALMLLHLAFPGLPCDEERFARAVGEQCGLPITNVFPTEEPELLIPDPARVRPDVFFHPTFEMNSPLLREARARGARVTLDGHGGDDVMQPMDADVADQLRRGELALAADTVGLTSRPTSLGAWRALVSHGLRALLPERAHLSFRDGIDRALRRRRGKAPAWIADDVAGQALDELDACARSRAATPYPGPLSRALHEWITSEAGSLSSSLAAMDRFDAHHGVERRCPFYDRRLIELELALPRDQHLAKGLLKPVLRRAMNGTLPPVVRERPDFATFDCYIVRDFLTPQRAAMIRLFRGSSLGARGMLDEHRFRELLGTGPSLEPYRHSILDTVALELWLRNTFDAPRNEDHPTRDHELQAR